jgi:hypothetical protein
VPLSLILLSWSCAPIPDPSLFSPSCFFLTMSFSSDRLFVSLILLPYSLFLSFVILSGYLFLSLILLRRPFVPVPNPTNLAVLLFSPLYFSPGRCFLPNRFSFPLVLCSFLPLPFVLVSNPSRNRLFLSPILLLWSFFLSLILLPWLFVHIFYFLLLLLPFVPVIILFSLLFLPFIILVP